MALPLILGIASLALSGVKFLNDYNKGQKDIESAAANFELSKEAFELQKEEFANSLRLGKIDLQDALTSAKSNRLDILGKRDSLGITIADFGSKVSSYDEFLTRFPAFSALEQEKLAQQGRMEFRGLRNQFGQTNVSAAERGQSGGSAALMSAEAMEDLALYAGDDLSLDDLATGRKGLYQKTKEELVLDLSAKEREARTQKGIYEASIKTLTTSEGEYNTAIKSIDDSIDDIDKAIKSWDAWVDEYLAGFVKKATPDEGGGGGGGGGGETTTTEQTSTVETLPAATTEGEGLSNTSFAPTGDESFGYQSGASPAIADTGSVSPEKQAELAALAAGTFNTTATSNEDAQAASLDHGSYTPGTSNEDAMAAALNHGSYGVSNEDAMAASLSHGSMPYIPATVPYDPKNDPYRPESYDPYQPIDWSGYGEESQW